MKTRTLEKKDLMLEARMPSKASKTSSVVLSFRDKRLRQLINREAFVLLESHRYE